MRTFFRELKKRRVYRVAIVYGVVASAAVQLAGTVLPAFDAPVWTQQVFLVALALGFPVALILAWAFDLTRSGIQRTPSARGLRVVRTRQMWLLGVAGFLIAGVAVTGYWFWHPWRNPRLAGSSLTSGEILDKGIAVLPFQNLSAEPSNAFFTQGVQDQILTDLAKVADLKVSAARAWRPTKRTHRATCARSAGNWASPTSSKEACSGTKSGCGSAPS